MSKTIYKKARISGKKWLINSISVWDDIPRTSEEKALKHPAMFPVALVEKLIDCFVPLDAQLLIDPFLGSGSALIGALNKKLSGIGFEVVPQFADISYRRLNKFSTNLWSSNVKVFLVKKPQKITINDKRTYYVINEDVRFASNWIEDEIGDVLVTSPPYWIVHNRKRTADGKNARPYSSRPDDIGNIENYDDFLIELQNIFTDMYRIMKGKSFSIVNVMDLRYGSNFLPFHIDMIKVMEFSGFTLEDIIIWNRAKEYNKLRPLGYPYKFIVNKVHEYLLVFSKK
ncbi:DNA methyltransferase [bacterium]|nr:DNA methyltransferase [bacterium]